MSGSLLQLVAKGADNIYLIKDPQITLFKTVYRRHTNFSIFDANQSINTKGTFGTDFQVELNKMGDLLHKIYLVIKLPKLIFNNPKPTKMNIKKILAEYGISWDDIVDLVTLKYYNEKLIMVINNEIRKNIDLYNFYANGNIMSSSSSYLKNSSQTVLFRMLNSAFDYVFAQGNGLNTYDSWGNQIKEIALKLVENKLSGGTVSSLMLLTKMLTKYSEEYSPIYSSKYFPNLASSRYYVADDEFGVKKDAILMFSDKFRNGFENNNNIVFNTGVLLQMLLNYYYDTSALNINSQESRVNHGQIQITKNKTFISNSLFGELLNRPPDSLPNDLVDFSLYTATDIKNIYYIALMYNLTRIKINNQFTQYDFNMEHNNTYIGNIKPPIYEYGLIGLYNPYISNISNNVIFYHSIDQNTNDYSVQNSEINQNIKLYFDNKITEKYELYAEYKQNFPFIDKQQYVNLDSYKIYLQYISQVLLSNDKLVKDEVQTRGIANLLKSNISLNIQYNFALIRNMMDVINNSTFDNELHYRFSFYKQYKLTTFVQVNPVILSSSTFSSNSDNNINTKDFETQMKLNDQFERAIRSNEIIDNEYFLTRFGAFGMENIPNKTTDGTNITNFFSNKISMAIQKFRNELDLSIKDYESMGYMNNFEIWKRGIFDNGNKIEEVYTKNSIPSNPQFNVQYSFSDQCKKIAIMNHIPFLAARDIPDMIYFLFSTIPQVKTVLGIKFVDFLNAIDYRDSGDNGAPILDSIKETTKKSIYQRIINATIGIDTMMDLNHFNQIVDSYSDGNYLLDQTFRPETLFPKYSLSNLFGNLIDQTTDISYLPLEWLTQTYFHIFEKIISDFFIINGFNTTDKDNFVLLLKSIVNCFIVYTFPNVTYTQYSQNGYMFLGLFPETSLAPNEYLTRLQNDYLTMPLYCDATSTIRYQLEKKSIISYNKLFNETLISESYYKSNIGKSMNDIFDFVKHTINGDRCLNYFYDTEEKDKTLQKIGTITDLNTKKSVTILVNSSIWGTTDNLEERIIIDFGTSVTAAPKNPDYDKIYDETFEIPSDATEFTVSYINKPGYQIYFNMLVFLNNQNYYYEPNINGYIDKIIDSYNIDFEQYVPINVLAKNYDFYRLRNFNIINKYTGKTKLDEIKNYLNDNITLINNNISFYENNSLILQFNRDSNLTYKIQNTTVTRDKVDYIYEESEKICNFINDHIQTKYIDTLPLTCVSNDIVTVDDSVHQLSDVIPNFPQKNLLITTNDIIGFSFSISGQTQNDYAIGYAKYQNKKIQIRKIGNNFYLYISDPNDNNNIVSPLPNNFIPISINPTETTKYTFIQNNLTQNLDIYENSTHVININSLNTYYSAIISNITDNINLCITGIITVNFIDIYSVLNDITLTPIIANLNSITKWFYAGVNENIEKNFTTVISQQQILHTVYDDSIQLNKLSDSITTKSTSDHNLGQSLYSPVRLNSNDLFACCFTVWSYVNDSGVGFLGNGGSITIKKDKIILTYGIQTVDILLSQELTFLTDNLYYLFYDNSTSKLYLYETLFVINPMTGQYELETVQTFDVEITVTNSISMMNNVFDDIMNFFVLDSIYVLYYMSRYSYQSAPILIKNMFVNTTKWYDIGGFNSVPVIPEITHIKNIMFTTTIENYTETGNNTMNMIFAGKDDYNEIVFPSGINLLTFSQEIIPQTTSSDVVGYAFSVIDGFEKELGIGLGIDGYFSNKSIQMYRNDTAHYIRISDDGITSDDIQYDQNPIYDASDIYYCFQDNNAKTFTVYESKNIIPLVTISISSSQKYDNLIKLLENSANLFITGKATIRYYTANYAITQASAPVKTLIENTTQWFYIGSNKINNTTLKTIYRNHTGFYDEKQIKPLNSKLYYMNQLENINFSLNPNAYNNIYNLNGIHAVFDEKLLGYNTSIYGILDSIYNNHLVGNLSSTFKLLNLDLPVGKIVTDFISNDDNPFYSYALYDSFTSISSDVDYNNNKFKNNNENGDLIQSNLLTFENSTQISTIFNNTINNIGETIHALENLEYAKQPTIINKQLNQISILDSSQTLIVTSDKYDHVLSTNTLSITGIPITNTQFYGFSFTVQNIISDNIEIGIVFDENKIVIRNDNVKSKYDVMLQFTYLGSVYKHTLQFRQKPNFRSTNTYTFFIFNSNVSTTTINALNLIIPNIFDQVGNYTIQIYENFDLIFNEKINQTSVYANLFSSLSNINLFIKGQAGITFYSKEKTIEKSNTIIREIIKSGAYWFSIGEFKSITNYLFKNANAKEENNSSFTINQQTGDNIFIPTIKISETDIIGFAFEIKNIVSQISIGICSFDDVILSKIQIQKNNTTYTLNINNVDIISLAGIEFKSGNIYMCIQNNIKKTFSIYEYKNGIVSLIYTLRTIDSNEYKRLACSDLLTKINLLVSTPVSINTQIIFYTAKYIFNMSTLDNQILIGDMTKWLYIGALDVTPVMKLTANVEHHKFNFGLTPGSTIYKPSLYEPPISSIPTEPQPPIATFDRIFESSKLTISNFDHSDIILADEIIGIKPVGTGIIKLFNPTDPIDIAKFNEYVGLVSGPTTFKKTYSTAFSIINDQSDFSIGFFSWYNTNITLTKTNASYNIVINYLDFTLTNNEYKTKIIPITLSNITPETIFYAFQNNDDNTFSLYQENVLIIKISADVHNEYYKLLFQIAPPFYGTLKTICTLAISGTNNTTIRIYSNNYVNKFAPTSIVNILQVPNQIVWFGCCTVESQYLNNTADNRIIGINNNSVYLDPPVQINEISVIHNNVNIDSYGMMGFAFSIKDFDINNFNSEGLRIGFSDRTIVDEQNQNFSLIEMGIFNNKITVNVNGVEHYYLILPTFLPNNIYYIFQDNDRKRFTIYENATLIFSIDMTNTSYSSIINRFNNPIYLYLSGKMNIQIHNAPYAYLKTTNEIKIMIDNCTRWLSIGGANTGPIQQRKITSAKLFSDSNTKNYQLNKTKSILTNFSSIVLYIYPEILKNSSLQKIIDLKPFISMINEDENITINDLNVYMKPLIKKYFDSLLKITTINIRNSAPPEKELFVNGYNTFLDNIYRNHPIDYYEYVDNNTINHVYYDDYYRTGIFDFDYQLTYKITVNFFMPTFSGNSNKEIELERRLLKLITNAPSKYSWVKELGHKIIKETSVTIGDQLIETHTSDLLHLIHEFAVPPEQKRGYDKMIGNSLEMYQYSSDIRSIDTLYVPLRFWFCEHQGCALPLIALLHSRIMLNFKIENIDKLLFLEKDSLLYGTPKVEFSLLCQYVYLDDEERNRIAHSKLEYLIERYHYNGKNIISKNTDFSNVIQTENMIENTISTENNNLPVVYGLKNLLYHTHSFINKNGRIEPQRDVNFREVTTFNFEDYLFAPNFNFLQTQIIGFAFQVISFPEINPESGDYDLNLPASDFSIGLNFNISENINNKTITKRSAAIELHKTEIIIRDFITNQVSHVNYITNPRFRGGVSIEICDLYVCIHDNVNNKFSIYENSILIGEITNSNIIYQNIQQYSQINIGQFSCQQLNLLITGQCRAYFYNAKYPYNKSKNNLKNIMNNITNWIYLGGDKTPLTDVLNYQENHVQNAPMPIITTQYPGYTVLKINQNGSYICTPNIIINNDSMVAYSFSLDYQTSNLTYDLSIGVSIGLGFIQMRKTGNNYDIIIMDGTTTSSVNYIKNPILYVQDTTLPVQNKLYRPNIIYTCIQDNITKTFTIYEENIMIGQVDITNLIYKNLIVQNSINIRFDIDNLMNGPLILNYFTSEEMLENHAKLSLRRIINNITDWIAFVNFKPIFYVPSFRNISTHIIDDVSNKGIITRQTNISSDIITSTLGKHMLRPSLPSNITQTYGFSFGVINSSDKFEIGLTSINNSANKIVLKKNYNEIYLEITNTKLISILNIIEITQAQAMNMIPNTVQTVTTTSRINLTDNFTQGENTIYTIIQDNALGIFTLFKGQNIIGQVTTNNAEYKVLFMSLQFGANIILDGIITYRSYSTEHIYNILPRYLDRVDQWFFVQKVVTSITAQSIDYTPTPVTVKLCMKDPIKYFIWYIKAIDETTQKPVDIIDWNKYGFNIRDKNENYISIYPIIENMKLQMYGTDRENYKEEKYFTHVVPWSRNCQSLNDGEYMYSFALYPMLLQPSGAANYSEISDSKLIINFTNNVESMLRKNKKLKLEMELWGKSINILRITSGMAGLLFYS